MKVGDEAKAKEGEMEDLEARIALELAECELVMTVSGGLMIGEKIVTQKIGVRDAKILARHLIAKIPALQHNS